MTTTGQNFDTYQGVAAEVAWTATGEDWSSQTPTFAAADPDGDITVSGTAALVGSDTVLTVPLTSGTLTATGTGRRPYQLHVSNVGVVALGAWRNNDSYAD